MSVLDYLKDQKSKKVFSEAEQKAIKMFDLQKQAIKEIAETKGFEEITLFFRREKEAAENRLMTAKKDDLSDARAVYSLSKRFLDFLETRKLG